MKCDNDYWEIFCRLDWKPVVTKSNSATLTCKNCKGSGILIGPFMLEPTKCHVCDGKGTIKNDDYVKKPIIPEDLILEIKKTFQNYFKE